MRKTYPAACAACALAFAAIPADAVILGVSPNAFAPDVFAVAPSGPVLGSIGPSTFTSNGGVGDFTGTYSETAIADPGNVFGAGDVTILINVASTGGANDISRITASDFGAFGLVDVGYVTGTGNAPITVDRTTAGPVGFDFLNQIAAGESADTLVIETSGTFVVPGILSMINDQTSNNPGLSAAVPEPSTWAMLVAGFALLGALGWKKDRGFRARRFPA